MYMKVMVDTKKNTHTVIIMWLDLKYTFPFLKTVIWFQIVPYNKFKIHFTLVNFTVFVHLIQISMPDSSSKLPNL